MILECRICDKLFSHPVELRKHNIRKHEEFETSEDLNKTISSVQELKLRHLVFPVKKRKSIFEGVDVSEFKKRKAEESLELSKQNPQFSTIRPRNHNYKTTPTRRIESPTSAKVEEVETAFLNFTNSPKLDILAERDELEANKNGQIFKKNSQQGRI